MRELPDPFVLAVLLLDAVLLLLFFERLLAALRASAECYRSTYGTREVLGNKYLCLSIRQTFLLQIPFYAITLVATDVSRVGFGWTMVLLASLALFRLAGCRMLGWLTSRQAAFRAVERVNEAVCVLAMAASFPVFLLGWLAPAVPHWLLWILLAVIALIAALVYVWRGGKIILATQFSIYYWVLYLCALDFLPICVVVNILMHGN